MHLLNVDIIQFVPILIVAIPVLAIFGGISVGIIRTIGQQRLIELAQRERIAAIERGVDPAKLPQLQPMLDDLGSFYLSPHEYARRRSQGLLVAGIIMIAAAIGIAIFLRMVAGGSEPVWVVGVIPGLIGAALILCSFVVRPRNGNGASGPPSRP